MDWFRRSFQPLLQSWQQMSMARRAGLLLVVGIAGAVIVGVGIWATQPDYRMLYSGLAPEDAGAITSKLQSLGVPYKLEGSGSTILVPAEKVHQLRIDLAMEGLPGKGGKGFEIFDETSLGATPFTQHVNYLRALQAELARSIMQIDAVAAARVHVVRPEPSPFVRDQKPTTASVVLRLKPGMAVNRSVAGGIAAFVSRSVEGLQPENVTVLDTNGRVLSESSMGETGAVSSQLDHRRALESYLSAKAEEMLAQVLGPGRAIVRVTADLNFQRVKETKETFLPEGRVVESERVTSMKTTSTTPSQQGGRTGTATNVANRGAANGSPGTSNNLHETTETKFAISKMTQELGDRLGAVERLTVAALIDLHGGDGQGKPALSVADATDIIKRAVGFKTERDDIKVNDVRLSGAVKFDEADATLDKLAQWQWIAELIRNGSLAVAALVALVLSWMILRRVWPRQAVVPAPAEGSSDALSRVALVAQQDPEIVARALSAWLGGTGAR
jgi:flagellar M-ring protein FliF